MYNKENLNLITDYISKDKKLTFLGLFQYFLKRKKNTCGLLKNVRLLNFEDVKIIESDIKFDLIHLNDLLKDNKQVVLYFKDHSFSIIREGHNILILDSFFSRETSSINPVFLRQFKELNQDCDIYVLSNTIQHDITSCSFYAVEMLLEVIMYMKNKKLTLKQFIDKNDTKTYVDYFYKRTYEKEKIDKLTEQTYNKLNIKEINIPIPLVPLTQSCNKIICILDNNLDLLKQTRKQNQTYYEYLQRGLNMDISNMHCINNNMLSIKNKAISYFCKRFNIKRNKLLESEQEKQENRNYILGIKFRKLELMNNNFNQQTKTNFNYNTLQ